MHWLVPALWWKLAAGFGIWQAGWPSRDVGMLILNYYWAFFPKYHTV